MAEGQESDQATLELDTDSERVQAAGDLKRLLDEFAQCRDPIAYGRLSRQLIDVADVLIQSKRMALAYPAALALAQHAFDEPTLATHMRMEAEDRLRRMIRSEAMWSHVLERATGASGAESVRAARLIVGLGAAVAGRLLEQQERALGPARGQIAALLIAMGERAFPVLVEELCSLDPVRVRRASRLLGEMQNPRGVEFLLGQLQHPDPMVQKEVARALAWIGTEASMEGLISTLRARPESAEIAAAALGHCAAPRVIQALGAVASRRGGYPEAVRREALRSLGRIGSREALPVLREVLDDGPLFRRKRTRALRIAAAHALGRIGGDAAFAALEAHSRRGDPPVRQACSEALRLMARSSATRPIPS